jgi:hypothetical protein
LLDHDDRLEDGVALRLLHALPVALGLQLVAADVLLSELVACLHLLDELLDRLALVFVLPAASAWRTARRGGCAASVRVSGIPASASARSLAFGTGEKYSTHRPNVLSSIFFCFTAFSALDGAAFGAMFKRASLAQLGLGAAARTL